jgi:hypothetical protein
MNFISGCKSPNISEEYENLNDFSKFKSKNNESEFIITKFKDLLKKHLIDNLDELSNKIITVN